MSGRPAYAAYPDGTPHAHQATAAPRDMEARAAAFWALVQQLVDVMRDEDNFDEECLLPTERAIHAALVFLGDAAVELRTPLPEGALYPDGDGGLRIEWEQDERQIRLVIHRDSSSQDYIYHQERADYALEANVTAHQLAGWIRWLTGRMK